MTNTEKLNIMKARYDSLNGTTKSIKCPGVVRALVREIRNLESKISEN